MSEVKQERVVLTRKAILDAEDLDTKELFIPEWNGTVLIRGLSGRERDKWEASVMQQKGNNMQYNLRNARAKLASLCVVDEKGKRIFTDDDVLKLGNKSSKALDRIFGLAQDLSGISKEDVDELTKNSEGTLSEETF